VVTRAGEDQGWFVNGMNVGDLLDPIAGGKQDAQMGGQMAPLTVVPLKPTSFVG